MNILIVLIIFLFIFIKEAPKLYLHKMYKELVAFLFFFFFSLFYSLGVVIDYPVPNPQKLLDDLVTPLVNILYNQ